MAGVATTRPRPAPPRTRRARLGVSGKGFVIKSDELADRARKAWLLIRAKRITASDILEARDKDREAKRVEPDSCKGRSSVSGAKTFF